MFRSGVPVQDGGNVCCRRTVLLRSHPSSNDSSASALFCHGRITSILVVLVTGRARGGTEIAEARATHLFAAERVMAYKSAGQRDVGCQIGKLVWVRIFSSLRCESFRCLSGRCDAMLAVQQ